MSFIRPEARAGIWRWRELLTGLAVTALGGWWGFGTGGLLHWVGFAVIAIGAALIFVGFQRARFRTGTGGPGIVRIDEGVIAYFGPLTGGAAALGELTALSLDSTAHPAHWVLSQPGQPDLLIPVSAEGSEALFDAFASLPGLRMEHMLAQKNRGTNELVNIWQRPDGNVSGRLN